MIVENKYFEQIQKIWEGNNKGYIGYECNQRSIKDNTMLKVVYEENCIVHGYCVLYFERDFCEQEGYPNKITNIPDKVAYIWEIVTNKDYLKRGIATKILNYVKEKFREYTIYSCINLSNDPSLKLHDKIGFNAIYNFDQENEKYVMMELKRR